jgi:four helix bundle protein
VISFQRRDYEAMKDFRKLKVWQKSHALCLDIYSATTDFPGTERFGLTSQLRRSAASIPANIAEGCGRLGDKELARFLQIAMGSASETEYHILLAKDLLLLSETSYQRLESGVIEIKKMIVGMLNKLRNNDS